MDAKMKKLKLWQEKVTELALLKEEETNLRKELFNLYFVDPQEGTNTVELSNDWVLKGTHKLTRKIQEDKLPEISKQPGMRAVLKNVLKYKPSLDKKEYEKLPDDKRNLFDNCLVISPAMPSLSIVLPKRRK